MKFVVAGSQEIFENWLQQTNQNPRDCVYLTLSKLCGRYMRLGDELVKLHGWDEKGSEFMRQLHVFTQRSEIVPVRNTLPVYEWRSGRKLNVPIVERSSRATS